MVSCIANKALHRSESVSVVLDIMERILLALRCTAYLDVGAIYLGESQMLELKAWAEDNGYLWSELRPNGRPEIQGIPVYAVDAESHLHVA